MAKRAYGKRRKGISIAAGLVALSLVAQVAPATVLPIEPAVASAQESATPAAGAPIDADGIASKAITNMDQLGNYDLVNGKRGLDHGGMVGGRLYSSTTGDFSTVGQGNDRLNGLTVLSQWMDEDGAVSPVYSAKTHSIPGTAGGDGSYVFHYPNWTDGNGKVHEFYAKPYKVRIRLWVAPGQTGPAGGELVTLRQAPGVQPGFMNQSNGGAGMWSNVPQSFTFTGIFTYEGPQAYMYAPEGDPRFREDKAGVPSSNWAASDRSAVTGRVWWETGRTEGGVINFPQSTRENMVGAGEARVITSVLTREGVAEFRKIEKLKRPERIKKQQELLKAHPEYIAETVAAETNDKGEYYARFNHKNWDNRFLYQFVQVKDKDGKWVTQPAYSSYLAPMYGSPNEVMNIPQLWQDVRHSWANMHFGLVHQAADSELVIDEDVVYADAKVTPKLNANPNEGENAYVQWVNSKGENIKRDGTPGDDQIPVTGGHNIANPFEDATLTVPSQDKLTGDDTYTAQLYVNGQLVAADSVSVSFNGPDSDAAKYAPKYETTYIQPVEGKDLSVGCGVPAADDPQNLKPTGTSCKQIRGVGRIANIADIPADKIQSIKVTGVENTTENPKLFGKNANGWGGGPAGGNGLGDPQIKGIGWGPGTEANMKDLRDRLGLQGDRTESDIPVGIAIDKAKVGQYQDVNVEVTYADGSRDNIIARFVYGTEADDPNVDKPSMADQRDVTYAPVEAKEGTEASSTPKLTKRDAEGTQSEFPASEVQKFEKGESPEGVDDADWSVDPTTGEVTWTPKAGTEPGNVAFPVKVTYTDGSTDSATAPFTVKEVKENPVTEGLEYQPAEAPQGEETTVDAPKANGKELSGATFTLQDAKDFPWVTVDPTTGKLTLNPTADTEKKDYYIPVLVKESNGAEQLIYAEVKVTDALEKTAPPTVNDVTEGDTSVSGTTEPNAKVTVTLPDGTKVETTADKDGKFEAPLPEGKTVPAEGTVETTATAPNKKPSTPTKTPITKQGVTTAPKVDPVKEGDKVITGTAEPNAKVTVTLPDGTKVEKTADKDGKFEAPLPEGKTVPAEGTVETTATAPNKKPSTPTKTPITKQGVTTAPKVDPVKEGDKVITGTTKPGAEVTVTVPTKDGKTKDITVTAGDDGKFTAEVPADADVTKGKEISVVAKDGDNKPSKPATVTVGAADPAVTAGKDTVPANGQPTKLTNGKVTNPVEGLTGEVTGLKDKDGNPISPVVTIDPKTGEITVTIPEGTQPGEGTVTIKNGDKTVGTTTITVADKPKFESDDPTVVPGGEVTIPNNGADVPEGTKVTTEGPGTATINENGDLVVTADENAKPGDKITVTIEYPDGTKDTVTVTVKDKAPDLGDTTAKPGEDVTVPNDGGKIPADTTIEVTGPGTAKVDENGDLVVTADENAKPGDTITVTVTYPDGTTDNVTVTVGNKDINKSGFDTSVQPGPGESKEIPTKDGKPLTNGTTAKVIEGPGTAKVEGGKLIVTPNKDAKPGDKIDVQITYPDGTTKVITITVGIDMGLCVGASAASAIPLLLLTPIALGLAMDNQQVKDMTAGFGKTLEDINTGIQKTLGIYNPELAQQFKVQVAPHLQNLALAAGFIASIGLLAGVAASQCTVPTEGGLSSDKNADQAKPTASAQPTTEAPTSEAPTSELPAPEA